MIVIMPSKAGLIKRFEVYQ